MTMMTTPTGRRIGAQPPVDLAQDRPPPQVAQNPAFQQAMVSLQKLQVSLAQHGVRNQEEFIDRYAHSKELSTLLAYQSAHRTVAQKGPGLAVGKWLDAAVTKITHGGLTATVGADGNDVAAVLNSLDSGLLAAQEPTLPKAGGLERHISALSSIVKEELGRADAAVQTAGKKPNPALDSRWAQYYAANQAGLGGVDVNALVQAVLRESYLETTKDLYFYAEKVKFFNEVKKEMRDELARAREFLAGVAGLDDTALLEEIFYGKEFNTQFLNADAPVLLDGSTQALEVTTPDGKELLLAPELLEKPGLWAAVYALEMRDWDPDPNNYAAACSQSDTGDLVESTYYFMAVNNLIQGHHDDYRPQDLVADLKDRYGIEARQEGEGSGVDIVMPNGLRFCDCSGNGGMGEADLNFDKALGELSATMGFNDAGYSMEAGFEDLHKSDFVKSIKSLMSDTGSQYPQEQMLDMTMLAYMMEAADMGDDQGGQGKPIASKADLETYIKNTEERLSALGDDSQLANVDLQNILQKQQQTIQMMSNIAKMLHDTALAIVRKMSG